MSSSLQLAADHFRSAVEQVGDDQWQLDTPCPGWNVHELVGHVVSGSRMATAVVLGAPRNEAIGILTTDFLGDDPLTALDGALSDQLEAFTHPEAAERACQHPAGDMTGAQILGFRVADLVVHRWDLTTAIGADTTLDAGLVSEVWTGLQPIAPMIGSLGVFGSGPSGDVSDDDPLQTRLLDLVGRRPR